LAFCVLLLERPLKSHRVAEHVTGEMAASNATGVGAGSGGGSPQGIVLPVFYVVAAIFVAEIGIIGVAFWKDTGRRRARAEAGGGQGGSSNLALSVSANPLASGGGGGAARDGDAAARLYAMPMATWDAQLVCAWLRDACALPPAVCAAAAEAGVDGARLAGANDTTLDGLGITAPAVKMQVLATIR
jgi:hypothetical protein